MKPIRTAEDHRAVLDEIASLIGAQPGTPEADRLEILAVIASEYERRELPPESDPVDILALAMRGKGLSQAELSDVLGSRARASEVLSRRRNLSAEMIERLCRAWAIPRRLLASPPTLQPKRKRARTALSIAAGTFAFLATAAASPFLIYGWDLPDVAPLVAEAKHIPSPGTLPPHLAQAFIAAEDRNFLSHDGYDGRAILRATGMTVAHGLDRPQGGATLTQQLIKNTILADDQPRTIRRKVREILLARRLEQALGKDAILGLYMRHAYFGGGAFGIDAASRHYFQRRPAELSLGQAAYLASLVKAPSLRSFDRPENRQRSLAARREVLARMARDGFITPDTAVAALHEPLWPVHSPTA